MKIKRMIQLLIISLLFFGMAGGVSMVAAADTSFNPGYGANSDFFSPGWAPAKYTSSYSDSDFFSSSWAPAKYTNPYSDPGFNTAPWKSTTINSSFADPDFFTSGWTAPTYIPKADSTFLNPNWSVQTPVLFRYSGIDSTRINNYNLDPFASDAELRAQGWQISGGFMSWT